MASPPSKRAAAHGGPPSHVPTSSIRNKINDVGDGDRKRKADEAVKNDTPTNCCMILNLPQEVLFLIASFQYHKDRISVASTCCDLLKAVEAFSETKLEEMSHRADDTWATRIADQSLIETEMPKPLQLPNRYLLSKALQSHLYTLTGRADMRECVSYGLDAVPGGKSLVSCANDGMIRLWDLSTRQSKAVFHVLDRGPYGQGLSAISGDLAIASFNETIRVHKLNGELVHQTTAPSSLKIMAAGKSKVFFTCFLNGDCIWSLDLATGTVQENEVMWRAGVNAEEFDFLSFDEVLVVLRSDVRYISGNFAGIGGIHVFDTKDFSSKHVFPGHYHSIAKPADSSDTIVAARNNFIDILDLKHGKLSRRFSFSRSRDHIFRRPNDILLVYKSLAYVQNGVFANKTIEVYNILNGKLVQTFTPSASAVRASTNGHEIFFGFNTSGDNSGLIGSSIRAFPLTMV